MKNFILGAVVTFVGIMFMETYGQFCKKRGYELGRAVKDMEDAGQEELVKTVDKQQDFNK